ncbi:MAG: hypothetical protein GY757_47450, partial [bacterium]|nr:hypothetical protein [bacterium]
MEKKIQEIDQKNVEGIIQLAPTQKWLMQCNTNGTQRWNPALMLYKEDGFDEKILNKVLARLVLHHDVLRAVLTTGEQTLINRGPAAAGTAYYTLDVINLLNQPTDTIENKIKNETQKIRERIEPYNGPLLKTGLFKTKKGDHLLLLLHHLVIDDISGRILSEDLATGYRQAKESHSRGEDIVITFPKKTHSFKHWTEKLKQYGQTPQLLKQKDYWTDICARGTTEVTPPLP